MILILLVFIPFLCAIASYIMGRRQEEARDRFVIGACCIELALSLALLWGQGEAQIPGILACGLSFAGGGVHTVYALITAFMWTLTSLFGKEYFAHERENLNRYWLFVLMTLGATEGVMLSADLMTAFVFFEILSFTSFTWVIHEETEDAIRAGYTYLFIAVIGGLVLFMGLALLWHELGTLRFAQMAAAAAQSTHPGLLRGAGLCILLGFGAKAGMVPVHVWLPKAHPVAPSPASALLSGVLTKVGVYGILMTSLYVLPEDETYGLIVLVLGVLTMAGGAVLALFSINLKRTLACSSMSQVGFILTGMGMMVLLGKTGEEEAIYLALSGLLLHMVNHSLIKLTLFMAAGTVVMNLHTLTLDDIRGWGRNKQALKCAFALGALGISGVPLFNGYLSKTMLHEGIVEGIHLLPQLHDFLAAAEWIFLCTGGLTFAYMLKLFICLFLERNRDAARQADFDRSSACMNSASTGAVVGSSLLMILLGQPAVMTRLAAYMTGDLSILSFHAFGGNLKGSAISLGIGAGVYLIFVRHVLMRGGSYVDLWPQRLDLEERVYRPALTKWLPGFFGSVMSIFGENKVLTHLKGMPKVLGAVASVPGENRILGPLFRLLCGLGTVVGRVLETGTDGIVMLARKTILREKRVAGEKPQHPGLLRTIAHETGAAVGPAVSNFTFALMMTCIGIVLILSVLVIYAVG